MFDKEVKVMLQEVLKELAEIKAALKIRARVEKEEKDNNRVDKYKDYRLPSGRLSKHPIVEDPRTSEKITDMKID